MSSGASVRGSMTSIEIPRSASSSAAARASSTMPESATTVASVPSRAIRAWPNGIASPRSTSSRRPYSRTFSTNSTGLRSTSAVRIRP